ncbi:MAG TPA: hypothetical protein VG276_31265 [Actinomycetes bacterium]|nr:hypothetical protein [Actinomycetes bacterium]
MHGHERLVIEWLCQLRQVQGPYPVVDVGASVVLVGASVVEVGASVVEVGDVVVVAGQVQTT